METPIIRISSKEWLNRSLIIYFRPTVPFRIVRLMETEGQQRSGRVVCLLRGKIRDTTCGMLEFHDRTGIPFGWNKKLVVKVVTYSGIVVWS